MKTLPGTALAGRTQHAGQRPHGSRWRIHAELAPRLIASARNLCAHEPLRSTKATAKLDTMLVAIVRKRLRSDTSIHEIQQILSPGCLRKLRSMSCFNSPWRASSRPEAPTD